MARDDGDVFDLQDMSDDELRALIEQEFDEYPNLDAGWIDVEVENGFVRLTGSVGTDGEVQVAEQVLVQVIGVENFSNELVVTELHRAEAPEAADDAVARDLDVQDQLGEQTDAQSDTAEHLVEDLEEQTYGTHDMQTAIEEGTPYVPPDRPIPDGYDSRENH